MNQPIDRRSFLVQGGLLSAAAASLSPAAWAAGIPRKRQGKLRHAAIGCGGMGRTDLARIASHSDVEVVALCDIDTNMFEEARKHGPNAKEFQDYRVMFKEMEGQIDSCNVSTPDHMHAAIAMAAMAAGIHVYCQKPLTRTVAEARAMAKRAKDKSIVTQMGIQNHSNANYAAAKALFEQDLIGKIYEVHVWSDRPAGWWPQGVERTEGSDAVPKNVDWDLWLGIAPERPFLKGKYHPFQWRGREDFGTGAQGDMACHLMDPATWFLGLGAPLSIRSDGPVPNGESYPLWSRVHYTFPPNDLTMPGPLPLTWHDGGKKPPVDLLAAHGITPEEMPANACLFVGTEGALVANPYDKAILLPREKYADHERPTPPAKNHWHEWVNACLGRGETTAPFSYSAHLTEVALLGNIALRFPHQTLRWDDASMSFPDVPEANPHLKPTVRDGWSIDGM
ncbi:MAG: putative dehydrogenase [Planctomycetota bacterium]|jgi:predicted dehydrogenase